MRQLNKQKVGNAHNAILFGLKKEGHPDTRSPVAVLLSETGQLGRDSTSGRGLG